jgi:hypothetical protein
MEDLKKKMNTIDESAASNIDMPSEPFKIKPIMNSSLNL